MFLYPDYFSFTVFAAFVVPQLAYAVGPIGYLPFKGTKYLTCGYHLNCSPPPNQDLNNYGTDWGLVKGEVAYATGRGTVAVSTPVPFYGNNVTISHTGNYWSRYAHLWYYFPKVNHVLAPGMPVGYTGSTGCGSCGAHLHWHVYQQTALPDGNDPGVDPAPIPMPAPTPGIPANGFALGPVRPFTNNTNYDDNVYGCDETYPSCFTLSGSTSNCQWITGNNAAWGAADEAEGYFWQGANDPARVYQIYCDTVSGTTATTTGIWRPSTTNNLLPVGSYRVYAHMPDHPPSVTYPSSVLYKVYINGGLNTFRVGNQASAEGDLLYITTINITTPTTTTYVKVENISGGSGIKVAYDAIFWAKE